MPRPSLPPIPTHRGIGIWIAAIVVMLLAIVGLLYFRFGRSGPELPKPAPTAAASTDTPVFETAPPPPPPAEPDSGKADATPAKKAASGGGCSAACEGQVTPALQGSLRSVALGAQACYERALRQNTTLSGRLVVAVKVRANGGSCGASMVQDALGDVSVSACVLQKFRSATFAPPVGGCVDVQVPISFKPKTQ